MDTTLNTPPPAIVEELGFTVRNVGIYGTAKGPGCIVANGMIVWCQGATDDEGNLIPQPRLEEDRR